MKATVEYDGGGYAGFQRQTHLPTIQAELERAVCGATQNRVSVVGAGRTDSGAHATGQVVAFTIDSRLGDEQLMRAINAHLPKDIAIQELITVEDTFHPRFDALLTGIPLPGSQPISCFAVMERSRLSFPACTRRSTHAASGKCVDRRA